MSKTPETMAVEQAVARLVASKADRKPCAPVRDLLGADDVDAAYAVQDCLTKAALADGRRLVGRKIGLTAKSVQHQLGVDQPDYGMLFADMDVPCGHEVPDGELLQPKCEAEIAFIMGKPLDDERLTIADIVSAADLPESGDAWLCLKVEIGVVAVS